MTTTNASFSEVMKDKLKTEAYLEVNEIKKILKDIWHNICILEMDYGIEWEGHMTQILKFTIECIADKYNIDLGLNKEK